MQALWSDLRYGARMLLKNPGFSLAAIVTLALGIGGNTAVFTVINALLLKAFPYGDPQQLVLLNTQRRGNNDPGGFTLNRYDLVRARDRSFSGLAVFTNDSFNLTGHGEPQQVPVARVSPDFFAVLGVTPQLGRTFSEDEGQPAGKPVVMISDTLWHTRFGGDPHVVGQSVTLDASLYTIIGVLPAGVPYPFVGPAEVWSPRYFELTFLSADHLRAGTGYLTGIARLKPGISIKSATAEMEVLHQQYSQENPKAPDSGSDISMVVGNLQTLTVGEKVRSKLKILSEGVGVVLLIACANVAGLLLARALARKREIAIRTALGAPRSVLIRQLLTESVLLSLLSGALGLALGFWGTRTLGYLAQSNFPRGVALTMDASVLLFTLVISVMTGVLFGIFPALHLSRTDVNTELRDEGRGTTGGYRRVQVKNILVVVQIALCMVLLVVAGLLVKTFINLQHVELGFDPQSVLTMNVSLPTVKYAGKERQIAFFDEVLRKVGALPGVRNAATSAALPLNPRRVTPILAEGQPEVPLAQRPFVIIEAVSPGWFQTLRVPIKMGRGFNDHDNAEAPKVIIINETLARHFWANENPVGKHIIVGRQQGSEVVGVAADVKNSQLLAQDPQPHIYLPFPQLPWGNMNLLVRTAVEPHQLVSAVQQQIYSIDSDQPITNVQTVDELLATSLSQSRLMMFLIGTFTVLAVFLAMVGLYGVISYMVEQRRPELGIRLALGADKPDIARLVIVQGLLLTLIGIGIGLIAALLLTRLLSGELDLYKVNAWDPTSFLLSSVLFLVIAALASYLPALRATRVHPTEALRQE